MGCPTVSSYAGTFTLTQYAAPSSGEPFSEFDESQPVATFIGTVTATRGNLRQAAGRRGNIFLY
jgi:hypothetical protein